MTICNFLDTGVLIGYSFTHDKYQQCSCKCIDDKTKKYSSEFVKKEFHRTHRNISTEIGDDVRDVIFQLKKKPPGSQMYYKDLAWMINLKRKKRVERFLQYMANEYQSNVVTFNQMANELDTALRYYLCDAYQGLGAIDSMIGDGTIICWHRQTSYQREYAVIQPFVINTNDTKILLDAHDLAINMGINDLDFITSDGKEIKKNEGVIVSTLRLLSVRLVTDFT